MLRKLLSKFKKKYAVKKIEHFELDEVEELHMSDIKTNHDWKQIAIKSDKNK